MAEFTKPASRNPSTACSLENLLNQKQNGAKLPFHLGDFDTDTLHKVSSVGKSASNCSMDLSVDDSNSGGTEIAKIQRYFEILEFLEKDLTAKTPREASSLPRNFSQKLTNCEDAKSNLSSPPFRGKLIYSVNKANIFKNIILEPLQKSEEPLRKFIQYLTICTP